MTPILQITREKRDSTLAGLLQRFEGRVRQISRILGLAVIAALIVQPASAFAAGAHETPARFAPAGVAMQGEFLRTFQKYGLSLIGYPISDEIQEGGTTVQYFERVKMEYHPELAAKGTPVLFARLGSEISAGSPFSKIKNSISTKQKRYFNQTSHSVAEPFLSFWRNKGGVALFGYPISEVVQQDGMRVQWFERARMEYHPEAVAKGRGVQLTLLGRIAYGRKYSPAVQPAALIAGAESGLNGMETSLLSSLNAQRTAARLPAVALNGALTNFARSRSNDMANRNYFAHVTPEGKTAIAMLGEWGIKYSLAGEILTKNNYPDDQVVDAAINSFLQSPPHRAIMLDGRYTQIGVGYAKSNDGVNYFTVVFTR